MTVITLGEAEQEFAESVDYYESNEAGLGARFRDEVAEAVQRKTS
jgi:N-methylhydantoinase B/oxoprolinase/acetone carboxylase alpha subunit